MKLSDDRRRELISDYVDRIIDNMSTKDLCRIVGEQLEENLESYASDELLTEIADCYPEVLNEDEALIYAPQSYEEEYQDT